MNYSHLSDLQSVYDITQEQLLNLPENQNSSTEDSSLLSTTGVDLAGKYISVFIR